MIVSCLSAHLPHTYSTYIKEQFYLSRTYTPDYNVMTSMLRELVTFVLSKLQISM
jgi:hypothetical protein